MPLVKNGQLIDERFLQVADDVELPATGALLLPAARILAAPEEIFSRQDGVGVIWPNDRDVHELQPLLTRISAVALVFPNFRDGRAYSQARLIRERFGYRGELRATGQVLRDQFVFMLRAGFDVFDVRKASDADAFVDTVKRYSVFYQPTGDERVTALHRRIRQRQAAESSR